MGKKKPKTKAQAGQPQQQQQGQSSSQSPVESTVPPQQEQPTQQVQLKHSPQEEGAGTSQLRQGNQPRGGRAKTKAQAGKPQEKQQGQPSLQFPVESTVPTQQEQPTQQVQLKQSPQEEGVGASQMRQGNQPRGGRGKQGQGRGRGDQEGFGRGKPPPGFGRGGPVGPGGGGDQAPSLSSPTRQQAFQGGVQEEHIRSKPPQKSAWAHRPPHQGDGDAPQLSKPEVVQKQQPPKTLPKVETGGDSSQVESTRQTSRQQKRSEGEKKDETSILDYVMPQRKHLKSGGTAGRPIWLETNHLALRFKDLPLALHYDVDIQPDKPKKLMRQVMEAFRRQYYPQRYPAFDGTKNLYASSRLPFGNEISGEVTIIEDERAKEYEVTVKYAATVDLSILSRYFENAATDGRHMVTPQDAIQCIDVVLRSAPALRCIPVGRSFFTKPQRSIDLGDGMEMFYGFYQSAVLGWKPFLNVDVSHKAFPKSVRLTDLIEELCGDGASRNRLGRNDFDIIDRYVRNLKVQYEIPNNPSSRRVMRINQLDGPANQVTFLGDNGNTQTVEQYFKVDKAYPLRFPHLPCVWVGRRDRESKILLPVELCILLPGQVTNRSMTPTQTSAMIRVAATSTQIRKQRITDSITVANFNADKVVKEFGLSVNDSFEKIKARVLDPPQLRYATRNVKPERGQWRPDTFFKSGNSLQKWVILNLDYRTQPPHLQTFAETMIRQGQTLGMTIARPNIIPRGRNEKPWLEEQFKKLSGAELVVVVINDQKDIYSNVKQAAELTAGILTQCVKGKNVARTNVIGNILLKVNAKLSGTNHILTTRPRCFDVACMIMGADVTHPSPETRGTVPSVAAVTASHDRFGFQYNICWRLQQPGQEIIEDLANMVKEHLLYFYKIQNQVKPQRIIFFRDGVSEGQFEVVVKSEVNAIRKACQMVQADGSYQPAIVFLVVQKRHHTRFFPTNPRDSEDRNMNVPAGTIVDTDITHPTAVDFYLVSHASIQGVARPTKYRKLWDDCKMSEDDIEQLTYHLCHLFTRCNRSVSYPAPTYYAHLAAARAKVYSDGGRIDLTNLPREQQRLTIKPEIVKGSPMFFV